MSSSAERHPKRGYPAVPAIGKVTGTDSWQSPMKLDRVRMWPRGFSGQAWALSERPKPSNMMGGLLALRGRHGRFPQP